jgi:EAL domain-containing protein (putative c-di-GMP-specific phosphodiesterase class I)
MVHLTHTSALDALLHERGGLRTVSQPIVDLTTGRPVAYEALARFGCGAPTDAVFDDARRRGLGHQLEAEAIASALRGGPPPPGTRLSVNLSPSALTSAAVLAGLPEDLTRITVEVTENELVAHEEAIEASLAALRARGAQIAVDDAGAGYASLRQVMQLGPDIIKLDRSLIMGAHADPAKRALIRAFVAFGHDLGGQVCAEGIEVAEELRTLADLDVSTGQGYLFARPGPDWPAVAPDSAALCSGALGAALRGTAATDLYDSDVTLETVGRALAACRTYEDLGDCLETIGRLLDAPEVSISRLVDQNGVDPGLLSCAGLRWQREPVYPLASFPATARALTTDEALQVLVSDAEADAAERALLRENGYEALLLIPLRFRGAPAGTMEIFSTRERAWTRRQITLARAVAHQIAMLLAHLDG